MAERVKVKVGVMEEVGETVAWADKVAKEVEVAKAAETAGEVEVEGATEGLAASGAPCRKRTLCCPRKSAGSS